ncbi:hypothetical protein BKA82DRAFT_1005048 [Pisolithus tinctorius]|uniref:Uncharacterized protein n=1 Tax=Pisolithus tinctorius Marx 270 TaxID=870435 RepID=A0A0C3NCX3_PISTI|nr:hypothetical protein BKA82DRAFT_1005048 [Pisolithus tinctorius]KIN98959.1 hypothetical protein M404DRAFT_1005048 [Pisolithus tinctorius Marx 270]
MLTPNALLRVLRLPKLFLIIYKRLSAATLQWLRYLLSFWNASVAKWKRKYLLKGAADSGLPSITRIMGGGRGDHVTLQCSEVGSAALDNTQPIIPAPTSMPAAPAFLMGNDSNAPQMQSLLNEGNTLSAPKPPWHPPPGTRSQELRCCAPPLRKPLFTIKALHDILCMLFFLDHPGVIGRCLKITQVGYETDVGNWKVFWCKFRNEVENTNLLATVLLAANIGFLGIQSVDQQGLTHWPERLCYMSLLCALGSIMMGIAVRTPRFFTAHSPFYFKVMVLILDVPFEFFFYGLLFFLPLQLWYV